MKYHGPTPQLKKKQGLLKPQCGPTLQVHVPCPKPFNNDASYHIYHFCYEKAIPQGTLKAGLPRSLGRRTLEEAVPQ